MRRRVFLILPLAVALGVGLAFIISTATSGPSSLDRCKTAYSAQTCNDLSKPIDTSHVRTCEYDPTAPQPSCGTPTRHTSAVAISNASNLASSIDTQAVADHYALLFKQTYNSESKAEHRKWRIERIECSWSSHVRDGLDCKVKLNQPIEGSRCGVIGIDTGFNLYFSHGVRCSKVVWRTA
jgi:hypothetical protein